uniref:(California timema) hypothetical protein n=1 Tax=Timema californicum TaxID=61474 RepID=A0A7R9J326_TIMCA|nr:unnamed protein product [Timema californicum]
MTVNSAFTTLRTLIPTEPVDRKLSKIETLRLASSYISHLQAQLVAVSRDYPRPFVRVFFIMLDGISTHPVSANLNVALLTIQHVIVQTDDLTCMVGSTDKIQVTDVSFHHRLFEIDDIR